MGPTRRCTMCKASQQGLACGLHVDARASWGCRTGRGGCPAWQDRRTGCCSAAPAGLCAPAGTGHPVGAALAPALLLGTRAAVCGLAGRGKRCQCSRLRASPYIRHAQSMAASRPGNRKVCGREARHHRLAACRSRDQRRWRRSRLGQGRVRQAARCCLAGQPGCRLAAGIKTACCE